jgi:hypothetical protein
MTLLEIYNYFEAYAVTHPDLKHVTNDDANTAFVSAQTEEESADDIIGSCARDLIMVMLPYDKNMLAGGGDSFNWSKGIAFLVLKRLDVQSSPKAKIEAQSLCEEIANDFITRILADRLESFGNVDLKSFQMKAVGPVSDNRYGQICLFMMEDYFEHWVNQERWQS